MQLQFCIFIITLRFLSSLAMLDTIFEWNYIDNWKQQALYMNEYNLSRILPMDIHRSHIDGRYFISFVKNRGVTATLGVISNKTGPSGPLIKPFPDWRFYRPNVCHSIISVYRFTIDKCNRLWMVDNGYVEDEAARCPPKLTAFDLFNDSLILKIDIPTQIANKFGKGYLFTNTIVETDGIDCENTKVYMSESFGGSIVVWNGQNFTRYESPTFAAVPQASTVSAGGYSMTLSLAVEGMDISPQTSFGEPRFLFYRPLASYDLFSTDTGVFNRPVYTQIPYKSYQNIFSSQVIGQAFSLAGTLFMGMSKESAIRCWNRYRPMSPQTMVTVAQCNLRLEYPNAVKVIPPCSHSGGGEQLLVLSNRFTAFELGRLSVRDINFRVLSSPVERLVAGTACTFPKQNQNNFVNPAQVPNVVGNTAQGPIPNVGDNNVPNQLPNLEDNNVIPNQIPNLGGNNVPNQIPNLGGNNVPNQRPNLGGNNVPNQIPNLGSNAVPNQRPNLGSNAVPNQRPNLGSTTVPYQRPSAVGNPMINQRPNVAGNTIINQRPNLGGNTVLNQRPNRVGNTVFNQRPNVGGNRVNIQG